MFVLSKALVLTQIFVTGFRDSEGTTTGLLSDSVIVSGEVKVFSVFDPTISVMKKTEARLVVKP